MKHRKKNPSNRLVAVEINSHQLNVCVSHVDQDGTWDCRTNSVHWRRDATSLNTERGQMELAEAVRRVASEMKLSGATVWVALTGKYCVTRITTGDEAHVRDELAQLMDRSELYLSLGHGPKSLASSTHTVDARRRHGLLSVVNQGTIDSLVSAFGKAGMKLERIESTPIALARLVGAIRDTNSSPALIVSTDDQGVDFGIAHNGLLMLDYRPASADDPQQLPRHCFDTWGDCEGIVNAISD